MSMSIDGFVAGPNGETEWMMRGRGEAGKAWVAETIAEAGLHAVGRKTFLGWARYWPTSTDMLAQAMNDVPKVVFTRQASLDTLEAAGGEAAIHATPAAASWAQAEVANGDLATEIDRLKHEPGKDILVCGGVEFAQSLARLGLIDEYRLVVHPVALGAGLALFAGLANPLDVKLMSSTSFPSGVTAQVYQPA
jgi:dihydrofolate reductase